MRKTYSAARTANGQASQRGKAEDNNEMGDNTARNASQATISFDGRHSRRQVADALDERCDFDIGDGLVAHEPSPELVVFGVQKL